MSTITTSTQCTKCGHKFNLKVNVPAEAAVPIVAGKIRPTHQIMVYNITSTDVTRYITDVVQSVVPNAQVLLYPRYTEKKRKKSSGGPKNSYVYMLLAMNESVIESKQREHGFYGSLGWQHSVRIRSHLWFEFIQRWLYDQDWIRRALNSYNQMDDYEEKFGITERALKDISFYSAPKAIYPDGSNTPWVFTAIDPFLVIQDMLCEAGTHKVPGDILITNVNQLNQNMIEWTVHVSPFKNEAEINPHVMQILKGEEKGKTSY